MEVISLAYTRQGRASFCVEFECFRLAAALNVEIDIEKLVLACLIIRHGYEGPRTEAGHGIKRSTQV